MKKEYLVIIIVLILIGGGIFYLLYFNRINSPNNIKSQNSIEQILEYGEKLTNMDLLPNTIVAKLNGEPILFREIGTKQKQIDYSMDNSNNADIEKNTFYEVLVEKLYIEYAKKYPDEVQYNLDLNRTIEKTRKEFTEGYDGKTPQECKSEMLELMCIKENEVWFSDEDFIPYVQSMMVDQMLTSKGNSIISKYATDRPELVNDKEYEEKLAEYKKLKKDKEEAAINSNNANILIESITDSYKLLTEIRDIYIKNLIINSNIELCVEKQELYTGIPEIYQEEKDDSSIIPNNEINNSNVASNEASSNMNNESSNADNNSLSIELQKENNEAINNLDKKFFLTDFENYFPESNEVKISETEAKKIAEKGFAESAKRIAGEGVENKESETIKIEAKLPNNYFTRYYYEGDKVYKTSVRNCYVVTRKNEMGCGVSIYVDVATGLIIGGEAFGD